MMQEPGEKGELRQGEGDMAVYRGVIIPPERQEQSLLMKSYSPAAEATAPGNNATTPLNSPASTTMR